LEQTLRNTAKAGLTAATLAELSDVDTIDDLKLLPPALSIVVPVLDEESALRANLPPLLEQIAAQPEAIELIVVDGASSDVSREVAAEYDADVIMARRGRAPQMNAGARHARGDWLMFLHADCRLAEGALGLLLDKLRAEPLRSWGHFPARIAAKGAAFRLIEWGINRRSRWFGLPFGDQGIFVRRKLFIEVGAFPEEPTLEDVALVRMLGRLDRPIRPTTPLLIDARRWQREGLWRVTLSNWRALFDCFVFGGNRAHAARRRYDVVCSERQVALELEEGVAS
jgi:rSAM/selenodomain-associated transferase 2